MRINRVAPLVIVALALSGCANKGLRDLRSTSEGPDEFMIVPSKPLETPGDYAFLPAPTPGGSNRVDQNPQADAIAAIGGRPSALDPNAGIPAADGALVTAASRNGVDPDVRQTLASADADFRKRQSRLSSFKLFRVDRYNQAYKKQALDPFSTAQRYRNAGVATPAYPPVDE